MTPTTAIEVDWVTSAIRNRLQEVEAGHPGLVSEAIAARESEAKHGEATVEEIAARDAVDAIVGPVLWRRSIGETWNTTEVTRELGVTRQALAMRVHHNSLLALPARRSRLYPSWQFGGADGVWPVVATILRRWRQAESDVEPITIATWATTATSWDGDDVVPAELVAQGPVNDDVVLRLADDVIARRTR